ncbi:hypothetical protein IAD21_00927 [Abditibacteriota bacterium]|nr:hypothetical protein IAD21_00927 [Abditibacteriota bacterium]
MNQPTAPLSAEEIEYKRVVAARAFNDITSEEAWAELQKEFLPSELERIFATLDQSRAENAALRERAKAPLTTFFANVKNRLDEKNLSLGQAGTGAMLAELAARAERAEKERDELREALQWISVEEKSPVHGEEVDILILVQYRKADGYNNELCYKESKGYLSESGKWFRETVRALGATLIKEAYWRQRIPFPEPPKE